MREGAFDLSGDDAVLTGCTWEVSWRLTTKTGAPLNPLGWDARAEGRKWKSAAEVLFTWSTNPTGQQGTIEYSQEQFADPNDDVTKTYYRIHLKLAPEQSEDWDWDRMYYDVEMTAPDGRKARPVPGGWMEISHDTTRS